MLKRHFGQVAETDHRVAAPRDDQGLHFRDRFEATHGPQQIAALAAFDVAITQTLDLVRSCNVRLERLDFSGDISTLGPALDALAERLASL